MTDIYNQLTRHDFRQMDTDSLREARNQYSDAFDGIMSALRAMGSMAFWACSSDEYGDDLALEDLRAVAESLMYLPRIAEALKFNEIDADFELWCRKGLPTSYKTEDDMRSYLEKRIQSVVSGIDGHLEKPRHLHF